MTAPAPEKAVRDPATGRYAHSGDLSRVCVCGHELGDHVHGGFECLGAGAPCACEKFCPAPEKAAPIPAEDAVDTVASMLALNDGRKYVCGPDFDLAYKIVRALAERDRADRASQEERVREDEREAIIDLIASWPEIGGYTGDLRQSILSTVLDRDAAIIQAIRERGVMSAAIPEKVLELAMDAEVAIRNEDDHPTDVIARVIMQDRADRASQEERIREDERDRLYASLKKPHGLIERDEPGPWTITTCFWLEQQGAMPPADRARLRGDAS